MTTKFKRVLAVAVALTAVAAVSAQQSAANQQTNKVVSNDIDNYMSVNGYSSVDTGNFWGYASWLQGFEAGYAHQFGSVYVGGYIKGQPLPNVTVTPTDVKNTPDQKIEQDKEERWTTSETVTTGKTTVTSGSSNAAVLVGVNGIGIKAEVSTNPNKTVTTSDKDDTTYELDPATKTAIVKKSEKDTKSVTTKTNKDSATYKVSVGTNLNVGKFPLIVSGYGSLNNEVTYDDVQSSENTIVNYSAGKATDTTTTVIDNKDTTTKKTIELGGTVVMPLSADSAVIASVADTITSTNRVENESKVVTNYNNVTSKTTSIDTDTKVGTYDYASDNKLVVTPGYALTKKADKLTLKASAVAPITINKTTDTYLSSTFTTTDATTDAAGKTQYTHVTGEKDADGKTLSGTDDKANVAVTKYTGTVTKTTTTSVNPIVSVAAVYAIKPNVDFNLGIQSFNLLPTLKLTNETKETKNDTSRDVVHKTEKSNKIELADSAATYTVSSGITWRASENVTFDTTYDLTTAFGLTNGTVKALTGNDVLQDLHKIYAQNFKFQTIIKF